MDVYANDSSLLGLCCLVSGTSASYKKEIRETRRSPSKTAPAETRSIMKAGRVKVPIVVRIRTDSPSKRTQETDTVRHASPHRIDILREG